MGGHWQWGPKSCPCFHYPLTCRDPGQVDPPFQMSRCAGNNRGADLQTQHRGRGSVVSRCTETGNLSCSPYSSHHPTFSSVTPPPAPAYPSSHFFSGLGHQIGMLSQLRFTLRSPLGLWRQLAPPPSSLWSGSVCLPNLECEWIISEHICVSPSHCGPPHSPPALKRLMMG